jgi:hypothetical protein
MVRNDVPYIVEWIEYMRLQGVDRFVIYDDRSVDNIKLIEKLYAQKDPDSNVIVIPCVKNQRGSFQHCLTKFGKTTTWMLISDTDEFLFSPTFGTLSNMLQNVPSFERTLKQSIDVIYASCTRFGTYTEFGPQQGRFQYKLVSDSAGRVSYQNGCGLEMIINHTRRGPDERLSMAEAQLLHNLSGTVKGCKNADSHSWNVCSHGPGKSMFRPESVLVAGTHKPRKMKGAGIASRGIMADSKLRLAWCNHYYIRSRADALLKSNQWRKWDPVRMVNEVDKEFWATVFPPHLLRRLLREARVS